MRIANKLAVLALLSTVVGTRAMYAADQKTFASPSEAVHALVKAAEDGSQDEMLAVLGDDGKELVYSGDPVQDKSGMEKFVKSYNTKHAVVTEDDKTRILQVGANDWPMPIPIVNDGGKWRFDTCRWKRGTAVSSHRPQRTGRHRLVPWIHRRTAGLCRRGS